MRDLKQVIVVRTKYQHKDGTIFGLRSGKIAVQVAHVAMMFMTKKMIQTCMEPGKRIITFSVSIPELEWIFGSFKKICVRVDSEEELLDIELRANESKLQCHVCEDAGLTEFHGVVTKTCLAIGPNYSEEIDKITGHLKLF